MTLHLVRAGASPRLVDDADWVVYLDEQRLADRGKPVAPPGSIDHDQLVQLVFAADRVITW